MAPATACRRCFKAIEPGCGDRGFCADCTKEQKATNPEQPNHLLWQKKSSAIDKALDNAPWRRFRKALGAYNPRCQRVVDGVQCNRAGTIAHHLVGRHTDASRIYDPANVVMVCAEHHPASSDGEPQGSQNEYVPTRWRAGFNPVQEFSHPNFEPLKPGEVRITGNGVVQIG